MIPGSNLLAMALTAIAPAPVTYYQYSGRTLESTGNYSSTFASGVVLQCSVQAVDKSAYVAYGLDLQRQYITIYMRAGAVDLARDYSGDQVMWNTKRYQLVAESDWFAMDGWVGVRAVQLVVGT